MATMTQSTEIEEILKKPYAWNLSPQPDGTWVAEIREIPGCYVHKDTQEQAIAALRSHARELLGVYLRNGKRIPPPLQGEFSGHFALRLPKDLHRRAALHAQQDGVSLNQFIVAVVSAAVGAHDYFAALAGRTFHFVAQPGQSKAVTLFGSPRPGGELTTTFSNPAFTLQKLSPLPLEGEKNNG